MFPLKNDFPPCLSQTLKAALILSHHPSASFCCRMIRLLPLASNGEDMGYSTRCYAGTGTQKASSNVLQLDLITWRVFCFVLFCTGRCYFSQTGYPHRLDPVLETSFQGKKKKKRVEKELIPKGERSWCSGRCGRRCNDQQCFLCNSASWDLAKHNRATSHLAQCRTLLPAAIKLN